MREDLLENADLPKFSDRYFAIFLYKTNTTGGVVCGAIYLAQKPPGRTNRAYQFFDKAQQVTRGLGLMDDRIVQDKKQQWYYRARGGQRIGPFGSREAAELALAKQLRIWGGAPAPKAVWRGWRPSNLLKGGLLRKTAPKNSRRSGS
ncbi:MAG: hypothetical protein AAF993_09435 [Pseudomonadota bacterium]